MSRSSVPQPSPSAPPHSTSAPASTDAGEPPTRAPSEALDGFEDSALERTFVLRKPLERALRDGHPWVYRDAVSLERRARGEPAGDEPEAGAVARLVDGKGAFVARGLVEEGPIALRVFTLKDERLRASLLARRVELAASLRERVVPAQTDAYRLLHGEGDRLPGFVCDRYGAFAVLKTDGAAAEARRDAVVSALRPTLDALGVHTLLGRVGGRAARSREGASPGGAKESPKTVVLYGAQEIPTLHRVRERGATLLVDLAQGQKTGLFLDQREARARVRSIAAGQRVLNLYAYTGGFSIAAGLGGATSVETVDVAAGAVALADETWRANGLDASRHRAVCADAPALLAERARARARYDLIVADPPSFAPNESARAGALSGYRALHAACLGLLAPGGYYLAGSCSSHVDRAAFEESVLEGARRARRAVQLLDGWGAPADHPRLPAFPEGDYLKVLLFRVD